MSSEKINTVSVSILDKDYQVSCPLEEKAALMESARHLDSQMRRIRSAGKVIGLERIAVMAALNITHELIQEKTASNTSAAPEQIKRLNSKIDTALSRLLQLEI